MNFGEHEVFSDDKAYITMKKIPYVVIQKWKKVSKNFFKSF